MKQGIALINLLMLKICVQQKSITYTIKNITRQKVLNKSLENLYTYKEEKHVMRIKHTH